MWDDYKKNRKALDAIQARNELKLNFYISEPSHEKNGGSLNEQHNPSST